MAQCCAAAAAAAIANDHEQNCRAVSEKQHVLPGHCLMLGSPHAYLHFKLGCVSHTLLLHTSANLLLLLLVGILPGWHH
jgi:hypothetical protein